MSSRPFTSTVIGARMALRKRKETKQQPSMLPGPAVPGSCLLSFHFLWAILSTSAVHAVPLKYDLKMDGMVAFKKSIRICTYCALKGKRRKMRVMYSPSSYRVAFQQRSGQNCFSSERLCWPQDGITESLYEEPSSPSKFLKYLQWKKSSIMPPMMGHYFIMMSELCVQCALHSHSYSNYFSI